MVTLAQNKAMASCILLAGYGDLRIGVQLTQEQGVRVHLLGIRPAIESQSNFLRQEADTNHEWKSSDIESFLSKAQVFPKKTPTNVTSLGEVGTEIANRIPEDEISEILRNSKTNQRVPTEYFKPLMGWGSNVTKQKRLDNNQKDEVLNAFISRLRARKSKNPEHIY